MTAPARTLIDPVALMRIKSLELRARTIVEGFRAGLHRSPYHGFSVEFSEYRQYVSGDDPRYLDWKLLARTDRHYIRQYEDETNLRCQLLVDKSRSMAFGSLPFSKDEYAATLAATWVYFLLTQRDAAGIATFSDKMEEFIPARFRPGQLRRVLAALERSGTGTSSALAGPIAQLASVIRHRGWIVLISDLLAPLTDVKQRLGELTARGHDVCVWQVLDPAEIDLSFDEPAIFEDIETEKRLYVDPDSIRDVYTKRLRTHCEQIEATCDSLGARYLRVLTNQPFDEVLSHAIALMQTRRTRRR
jgi:uncharacterized protein (DUF58 family)